MNKITMAVVAGFAAVLFLPLVSSAQSTSTSTDQLRAEIQTLLAEVQSLEAQLQAQGGPRPGVIPLPRIFPSA